MPSPLTIAAFGKPGSYAHAATLQRFGGRVRVLSLPRARQVFAALREGRAAAGVLPLENTTGGWIGDVVSGLIRMGERDPGCRVVEELDLPVILSLASRLPAGRLDEIRRVYSHPVPLGHCEDWLSRRLPAAELLECASTSEAAEKASREKGSAAVCNAKTARSLGLRILVPHIERETPNLTRFVVISRKGIPARGGRLKTSLWFSLPDKPGSLRKALASFQNAGVNMTKIESRSVDAFRSYRFYVEVQGGENEPRLKAALRALARSSQDWNLIGSYPQRRLRPS